MVAEGQALASVGASPSSNSLPFLLGPVPTTSLGLAAVVLLVAGPLVGLAGVAILLGWTQIGGRCGVAHVNTMSMLWRLSWVSWARCVTAYWGAGLLSSCAVGAILALLGQVLPGSTRLRLLVAAAFGGILLLREAGVIRLPLPQKNCQTDRGWAYRFGWTTASAMWGFHIGLGFATVVTYGGFWLLAIIVTAIGRPQYGALVFGFYWLGRVLPLYCAPLLPAGTRLQQGFTYLRYRSLNVLAIAWMTVLVMFIATAYRS